MIDSQRRTFLVLWCVNYGFCSKIPHQSVKIRLRRSNIENNMQHYKLEKLSRKNIINEYILTTLRTSSGIKQALLSTKMTESEFQQFNSHMTKFIEFEIDD